MVIDKQLEKKPRMSSSFQSVANKFHASWGSLFGRVASSEKMFVNFYALGSVAVELWLQVALVKTLPYVSIGVPLFLENDRSSVQP